MHQYGLLTQCLLAKYHAVAVRGLGLFQYRVKKVKSVCPTTYKINISAFISFFIFVFYCANIENNQESITFIGGRSILKKPLQFIFKHKSIGHPFYRKCIQALCATRSFG